MDLNITEPFSTCGCKLQLANGDHDAVNNYGVLKARIDDYVPPIAIDYKPHFEFVVDAGQSQAWKIAVNCQAIQPGWKTCTSWPRPRYPASIAAQHLTTRQLDSIPEQDDHWIIQVMDLGANAMPTVPILPWSEAENPG